MGVFFFSLSTIRWCLEGDLYQIFLIWSDQSKDGWLLQWTVGFYLCIIHPYCSIRRWRMREKWFIRPQSYSLDHPWKWFPIEKHTSAPWYQLASYWKQQTSWWSSAVLWLPRIFDWIWLIGDVWHTPLEIIQEFRWTFLFTLTLNHLSAQAWTQLLLCSTQK